MRQLDELRAINVWPNPLLPPLESFPPTAQWPFAPHAKGELIALYAWYTARYITGVMPDGPLDMSAWWFDPLADLRVEIQAYIDEHDDRAGLVEACRAALTMGGTQ
nr:hypothetical protein [Mycobacterium sp. UM_NZ2]